MTTPVKPPSHYTPRKEIREWTDFDRLLNDKGDSSKGATASALLLTLLFHGGLLLSLPWMLSDQSKKVAAAEPPPEYTIQPLTAEDMKFVEANPNAPKAEKQDTPNIADRNQREAQKTPDLSNSDAPQVKGEQVQSAKIVTGDTRPTEPAAPPPRPASKAAPQTQPSPPAPQQPSQQPKQPQTSPQRPVQPQAQQQPSPQKPAPQPVQQQPAPTTPKPTPQPVEKPPTKPVPTQGAEQPAPPPPTAQKTYQGTPQPDQPPGEGVKVAEKPVDTTAEKPVDSKSTLQTATEKPNENKTTLPSTAEQAPPMPTPEIQKPLPLATVQATQPTPVTPPQPQTQPAPDQQPSDSTPMARKQVKVHVPAGPLMNNNTGTRNTGETAIRSNFSQFGNYEQRMLEAVSGQWNQLADKMDLSSAAGTRTIVVFTVNQQGEVIACQVVQAGSTSPPAATLLCTQAIQLCSPFGPWTADMTKLLGETQNVQITFWYR